MKLTEITNPIKIWTEWKNNYNNHVPNFIKEAQKGQNHSDWETATFQEYFERSSGQCVSSLRQGYFTNAEKEKIKQNWSEIASILKSIADNQSERPNYDDYYNLRDKLKKFTKQSRNAATYRLIAGLQPNSLCTVVNHGKLKHLHFLLKGKVEGYEYTVDIHDWFKLSNHILSFFKTKLGKEVDEIITLPWQTYMTLTNTQQVNQPEEIDMGNDEIEEIIEVLHFKKQIILQGPPGTGKTRQAKLIAKEILGVSDVKELDAHSQFEIVQFHPSYSYEDFVEGMKPVVGKNNSIKYETVNGSFKRICAKALLSCFEAVHQPNHQDFNSIYDDYITYLKTLPDTFYFKTKNNYDISFVGVKEGGIIVKYRYANTSTKEPGTHHFQISKDKILKVFREGIKPSEIKSIKHDLFPIVKHIAGELFAVYRHFYDFIQEKKIEIENVDTSEFDYTRIIEEYNCAAAENKLNFNKKFIVVIDEINRANLSTVFGELIYALEYRGNGVKSLYSSEDGQEFIIPPNLYIIGTMNTADRSVGHIDYAIRRRFAFVNVLPTDLSGDMKEKFASELFDRVAKLFDTNIGSDFKKEDVQLGHSYFIDKSEEGGSMDVRWNYEILPILKEYIKDGFLVNVTEDEVNALFNGKQDENPA